MNAGQKHSTAPRFFLTAPLVIIQHATKQHLPIKAGVSLEENASPNQKSLEVTQLDATPWPAWATDHTEE